MRNRLLLILLTAICICASASVTLSLPRLSQRGGARADVVIADFEGKDYGDWEATGTAFGSGPAQGTLPGQMAVSGYLGHGLANSFNGGDASTGTLTSPEFTISRKFINFLIGGGKNPGVTCINLLVDGKAVRTETGPNDRPGGTEQLDWATWDVKALQGRKARIEIVDKATGGWGHINVDQIVMSDTRALEAIVTKELYRETYRPQFHFTSKNNWLNDPNGMVYYQGEYHLFFQHNPAGNDWGNMTWGHAVSKDMMHWQQLPNAIEPDKLGTIFSGSAVVDWRNTSGFGHGSQPPLVAIYTAAGGSSPQSQGQPFTQCIAYSNDRGRTWTKYADNPVLPHIIGGNRDPKVFWHAPSRQWIMALYLDGSDYGLFASPDLKRWKQLQQFSMPGSSECPDFFELPIEESVGRQEHRWIFTGANGRYLIGSFDGEKFTPEAGPFPADYGGNYYAVQTYSDIPAQDGRRIQIAWMNGGSYPHMPFNQQMSFPCTLTLHQFSEGLRMCRWPVNEITKIYKHASTRLLDNVSLQPSDNPIKDLKGELFDIEADFELKGAKSFGFHVRGQTISYDVDKKTITCLGKAAPLEPVEGHVRLRLLVDRTSLELFGSNGKVSMTTCFLPDLQDTTVGVFTEGGPVQIVSLRVNTLLSVW